MELVWYPKNGLDTDTFQHLRNRVGEIAIQALTPWQHEWDKNCEIAANTVDEADLLILAGQAVAVFRVLMPKRLIYCNLIASLQRGFGTEMLRIALRETEANIMTTSTRNPALFLCMQKVFSEVYPNTHSDVPLNLRLLLWWLARTKQPRWRKLNLRRPIRKGLYVDNPPDDTLYAKVEQDLNNFFFGPVEEGNLELGALDAVMLIGKV